MHEMFKPNCCQITSLPHCKLQKLPKRFAKKYLHVNTSSLQEAFHKIARVHLCYILSKLLIAMILGGLSADINTQACLAIAQLILFKKMHQIQRITGTLQVENLLYLGLKLLLVTWSKKLVDYLNNIEITWTTLCGLQKLGNAINDAA